MRSLIGLLSFICLALTFGAVSCKQNPNTEKSSPLSQELAYFLTQTDSSWYKMMVSDDNKLSNLRRLSSELALISGSNEQEINSIIGRIDSLQQGRYDRQTMADSKRIDQYDIETNAIIADLRKVISSNPNASKYQIVNLLINEVQVADDSILSYRKDYDKSVDSLKWFVKENRKSLKKIVPQVDSLRDLSQFRLSPN